MTPTDSTVVVIRKVLTEYARGVHTAEELAEIEAKGGIKEEAIVSDRYFDKMDSGESLHGETIKEGLAETGYSQQGS